MEKRGEKKFKFLQIFMVHSFLKIGFKKLPSLIKFFTRCTCSSKTNKSFSIYHSYIVQKKFDSEKNLRPIIKFKKGNWKPLM